MKRGGSGARVCNEAKAGIRGLQIPPSGYLYQASIEPAMMERGCRASRRGGGMRETAVER